MANEFTAIDKETKKSLLNLESPSNNKGDISSLLDISKSQVKSNGQEEQPKSVEEQEPQEVPIGKKSINPLDNIEPSFISEDPNAPSEIDYTLSRKDFKAKYVDEVRSDIPSPGTFSNIDYNKYGKGVEDYRDYIDNPIRSKNLDLARALNQPRTEQARNAGIRFLLNIIPEVIQQGANMVEGVTGTLRTGEGYGNPVSEVMEDFKQAVNKEFDIYQERPEAFLQVGDFAWWADRGSMLATSATAFVALGFAIGGLGLGTKVVNGLSRLGKGGKAFKALLKGDIAKGTTWEMLMSKASFGKSNLNIASLGDAALNSYFLTTAESMGVATEVYHRAYEEKLLELLDAGVSEEDAEKQARSYAIATGDRAYMFNQINIALNLTSTLPFLRRTKLGVKTPKRTIKSAGQRMALEGTQEYFEESINLLSERRAFDEDFNFDKAMDIMLSREGFESGLLGLVGGIAQTGITMSSQFLPLYTDEEGNKVSDFQRYKKQIAAQEEISAYYDILRKEDKGNSVDIFNDLNTLFDANKRVAKLTKEIEETDDLDKIQKNLKEIEEIEGKYFVKRVYKAVRLGMAEDFIEAFEAMKEMTDEEAKNRNYEVEGENDFRARIDEVITQIRQLQVIYEATKSFYNGQGAYDYASNIFYFNNLLDKYKKEIAKDREELFPIIEKLTDLTRGDFTLDDETGNFTVNTSKATDEIQQEIVSSIEELEGEKEKIESIIASNKDKLSKLREDKDKDRKEEIATIVNTDKEEKKKLTKVKKDLKVEVAKLKESEKEVALLQQNVNDFINLIGNSKKYQAYLGNIRNFNTIKDRIEKEETAYNRLISNKGQKEARKAYIAARIKHDEDIAEKKLKRKRDAKEAKKKGKVVKTDTAKPAKPAEPVETTVDIEHEDVTEPKVKKPDVESKVVTKYDRLINAKDEAVTSDLLTNVLEFTEEEKEDNEGLIEELYRIFRLVDEIDRRETLLIGLTKKHFLNLTSDNTITEKIVDLFNEINIKNEGEGERTIEELVDSKNDALEQFNQFLDDTESRNLALNLDGIFFNVEGEEDEDDGEASKRMRDKLIEGENTGDKNIEDFKSILDLILEKGNLKITDPFTKVIKYLVSELGAPFTRKIFYKVQGYAMYRNPRRLTRRFETIVKSFAEKLRDTKTQRRREKASNIQDFDTLTLVETEKVNETDVRAEIFQNEGILLEEGAVVYPDITEGGTAKTRNVSNKVAYKVISSAEKYVGEDEYGQLVTTIGTGILNTQLDVALLKKEGVKIGDVITFEVRTTELTNSDGISFLNYRDKGIWKTKVTEDGVINTEPPLLSAPIQVLLNGRVLRGAFVHLPSFITSQRVLLSEEGLEQERVDLDTLRTRILNGEDVTKTVSHISEGHYIETEQNSTKINLPNVTIAFYNGATLISDGNKPISTQEDKKFIVNGIYALVPGNEKGDFTSYLLYKNKLDIDTREVIAELITLKLKRDEDLDKQDQERLEYYTNNGINIRSNTVEDYRVFNDLLNLFIFTRTTKKDYDIESLLLNYTEPIFFMKKTEKGISLNAGKQGYAKVKLKVADSRITLENKIKVLKQILGQTHINIKGNQLGKNPFIPSITREGDSSSIITSYNNFVKENTTVNIKSINVDGETVYRIQRSILFEDSDGKSTLENKTDEDSPFSDFNYENLNSSLNIGEVESTAIVENEGNLTEENMDATMNDMIDKGIIKGTDEDGKACKL